ncbi:hemolysin-III related-domain-containing protein [Lactarius psammicola]|nr:hemolysin-III related-domain-containing protein [Lactarius psammicola]
MCLLFVSIQAAWRLDNQLYKNCRTLTFAELPEWMKDNEFILSGYRGELNSWRKCLNSVFGYLHNETVNIHTHLHASVLFVVFLLTFNTSYFESHEDVSWADRAVFVVFLSAFFHMSSSHSKEIIPGLSASPFAPCLNASCDCSLVLILGSTYPCLYYGFFCEPYYKLCYLLLFTAAGLAAAYFVLSPEYRGPTGRHARTKVFISFGLCGVLPVLHLVLSHGTNVLQEMGFLWLLAAGAMYITGATLYANRVPERLAPGKFDLFFSSHQIFHVFVILAALSTYACVLTAFDHRHSQRGTCAT